MDFNVIPAIDLKDGEVVQLVGGETGTGESYGDPLKVADYWIDEGAEILHLIDLDGAINGEMKNLGLIKRIIEKNDVFFQVGGGIRDVELVRELFSFGVDRVILGTAAIKEPGFIEKVKDLANKEVFISVDSCDREIMIEGWGEGSGLSLEEGLNKFSRCGADGFLLTDISKEGRMEGINKDLFSFAVNKTDLPIIASGGISSINDLLGLKKIGAKGAVVGSALYKKSFKLGDAIKALEK